MLSGDLRKMSAPRVEVDQRARDTRLGLERIERLLVQRAGPMIAARCETFSAVAYTAKGRRITQISRSGAFGF